jgi:hypothetical protein
MARYKEAEEDRHRKEIQEYTADELSDLLITQVTENETDSESDDDDEDKVIPSTYPPSI